MEHIGIGPILQEARLQLGKTIEEASRETRIRAEYLQALEGERFESLIGDVYARAFLRSYSTYLGLDASSVVTIYNRHFGPGASGLEDPAPRRGRILSRLPRRRPRVDEFGFPLERRLGWPLAIGGAIVVAIVLAAVGILARAPSPKTGTPSDSIAALPPTVTVSVRANQAVGLTVVADGGAPERFVLRSGEGRSFQANSQIRLTIDRGSLAEVTVNGFSLGSPGNPDAPYTATFTPRDHRSASPAAAP